MSYVFTQTYWGIPGRRYGSFARLASSVQLSPITSTCSQANLNVNYGNRVSAPNLLSLSSLFNPEIKVGTSIFQFPLISGTTTVNVSAESGNRVFLVSNFSGVHVPSILCLSSQIINLQSVNANFILPLLSIRTGRILYLDSLISTLNTNHPTVQSSFNIVLQYLNTLSSTVPSLIKYGTQVNLSPLFEFSIVPNQYVFNGIFVDISPLNSSVHHTVSSVVYGNNIHLFSIPQLSFVNPPVLQQSNIVQTGPLNGLFYFGPLLTIFGNRVLLDSFSSSFKSVNVNVSSGLGLIVPIISVKGVQNSQTVRTGASILTPNLISFGSFSNLSVQYGNLINLIALDSIANVQLSVQRSSYIFTTANQSLFLQVPPVTKAGTSIIFNSHVLKAEGKILDLTIGQSVFIGSENTILSYLNDIEVDPANEILLTAQLISFKEPAIFVANVAMSGVKIRFKIVPALTYNIFIT